MSSSKTPPKPLLVVIGATGAQGGSVVQTFLSSSPQWRIRGVTRNPSSAASKALAAKGVEMVAADLSDPFTLPAVFVGATAIFAVTDFWGPFMALAQDSGRQKEELKPGQTVNAWAYEHELAQAKAIVDAAAQVEGLQRFVWSALAAATEISGGKYTWAYHFDSKADASEYIKIEHPDLWEKTSRVQVGFYATNHSTLPFMRPQKVGASSCVFRLSWSFHSAKRVRADQIKPQVSNGVYEIAAGFDETIKVPYIVAETDTGPYVQALVTSVPAGKYLLAYREMICLGDVMKIWGRFNGVKATVRRTTFEEDAALDMERAETFAFVNEYGYDGGDPEIVHAKDVSTTFSLWTGRV